MKFYKALNIDLTKKELICFVGGGGKTSSMLRLAKELKEIGKSILVTTTTKIYKPNEKDYDRLIVEPNQDIVWDGNQMLKGEITFLGQGISSENKLLGVNKEIIDDLFQKEKFDYILVECDGAKNKPIKAPAFHEPVIPPKAGIVVGVIGLDALNKRINNESVHRPNIFSEIVSGKINEKIDEHKVVNLITSKEGLFKGIPKRSNKYLFLNKAETESRFRYGYKIKELLKNNNSIDKIIIGSIINFKYDIEDFD